MQTVRLTLYVDVDNVEATLARGKHQAVNEWSWEEDEPITLAEAVNAIVSTDDESGYLQFFTTGDGGRGGWWCE